MIFFKVGETYVYTRPSGWSHTDTPGIALILARTARDDGDDNRCLIMDEHGKMYFYSLNPICRREL